MTMTTGRGTRPPGSTASREELAIRTLVVTLRDALQDVSDGRYPPNERRALVAGMIDWVRERLRQHASAPARDGVAARLAEAERIVEELQRRVDDEVPDSRSR